MMNFAARRLLASTALVSASMVAAPAFAQDAPAPVCPVGVPEGTGGCVVPPEDAIGPIEGLEAPSTGAEGQPVRSGRDITVTGTRIPQPNLDSASPVTVVTSEAVKLAGTSRTEDLINSLPQVFATQGSAISNGASGTATISLRGLGSKRSLVLVNGKRLQPAGIFNPVPDINFIPSALIQRVDILTGGASSVYGADAVAGVVNFILDTSFTGFRIDGQASVFNHYNDTNQHVLNANEARGFQPPRGWSTNGGAQDIAGIFGAAFDDGRGRVTAYATYRNQDAVLQASRDYSFCALAGLTQTQIAARPDNRRFDCTGSATSGQGTFLLFNPNAAGFPLIDIFQVGNTNQFVPGFTVFNFNPYNFFQRPNERYTMGSFGEYEITPAFKPYVELMFMDDQTDATIAPSGNFARTTTIACDNALLSTQQRDRLCRPGATFLGALNGQQNVEQAFVLTLRRNVEGGGRNADIQHTAYRIVGGMRGDAALGVSYDAYYQRGRTLRQETYENDFSITRIGRAMDVVRDGAGNLVCRAALTGLDPNCVPWNIFTEGAVSQAALDYLQTPGFSRGLIDQTIAHIDFTITGDEYGWRSPWAENGIGANVGAEYRKERLNFRVDEAFRTGDLAGQGGPTPNISGEFDVRELFAEIQLPIVENSFIHEFVVRAGYRYSEYNVADNSFTTDTYKIEGELAPIPDIRFRGSYNRAVRAPNIVELFFPQNLGLSGTVDPCAGAAPSATLAQCQLTGVTAAQYGGIAPNPANQYNALFGGNPGLLPEEADTYTVGVVLQPRFIPGLALTADYFNIRVNNVIGSPSFSGTFTSCFEGSAAACARIRRDQLGSLWLTDNGFVELTNQNFEGLGLFTKGFDFQGNYSRRLGGLGTVNAAFVGTLLTKLGSPAGASPGTFAGGTPDPKWRHTLRVGLTMPNGLGVSVRWRHFAGVNCRPEINPETGGPFDFGCGRADNSNSIIPANLRLSAQDYFDLVFTARLAQRLNLRIGSNNIFDRDPPVAGQQVIPAGFGNGNTYPQVYDALGRYLFAGFTVDF
ncbi:MAG TPA: TonB-dependent receptor [Sphingomicrobium sp.]|nr:TonB-dependent receptor [Sphingomicrobium sp.]